MQNDDTGRFSMISIVVPAQAMGFAVIMQFRKEFLTE